MSAGRVAKRLARDRDDDSAPVPDRGWRARHGRSLAMPPMELIPFSANAAGAALTLFGLALVAHDGLLAWLGLALTAGVLALVVVNLV